MNIFNINSKYIIIYNIIKLTMEKIIIKNEKKKKLNSKKIIKNI